MLTCGCVDDRHHPRDEVPRGGRRQGAEPTRAPGPDGGRAPEPEGPAGRAAEVQGDVRALGAVAGRQPTEQRVVWVMARGMLPRGVVISWVNGECVLRASFAYLSLENTGRTGGLSVFRWRVGMGGVSVYTVSFLLIGSAAGDVLILGLVLFILDYGGGFYSVA